MKIFLGVLFGILLAALLLVGGCTVLVGGCTKAVLDAEAEHVKTQNATNQQVIPPSVSSSQPSGVAAPLPTAAPPTATSASPPTAGSPQQEWADATQTVRQGDVQVRITKIGIDHVQTQGFGTSQSKDKLFVVSLEITNLNPAKILNYRGWGARELDLSGGDRASLKDDANNEYKRCHFGLGSRIVGQVFGSESIYPKKSLNDIVVFEPPTDACKFVLLELPASSLGGTGMFRIKIARGMWDERRQSEGKSQGTNDKNAPSAEAAAPSPPANSLKQEWTDATQPVRQDDVQVRITRVVIDHVQVKNWRASQSKDKLFVVAVKITNLSPTKVVNYSGWGARELDLSGGDRASLKDDTNNEYKRCHFGLGSRIVGQVFGSESIYPNKSLNDIVVFEPPTDACKFVLLELPASSLGGTGMFRIKIVRAMWDETIIAQQNAEQRRQQAKAEEEARRKKQEAAEQAKWHTWKSSDGKFSVKAKFLRAANDTIYLEKEDGKQITVSKDSISEEDLKWIKRRDWDRSSE